MNLSEHPSPIRVLVADDQALVRGALATLLDLESDIDVVAQAGTGTQALAAIRDAAATGAPVDVAVVDIEMPDGDGLWLAGQVTAARESGGVPTRTIIVTTFGRPGYLARAMQAGASGFLVKDASPSELARAVRHVHAGGRVIDPELAQESVLLGPNPLSVRESEVLRLAGQGMGSPHIAARLHLSEGTVRNYLSAAIAKTGTAGRIEAARTAEHNGWL